jgi:hypothetical protein
LLNSSDNQTDARQEGVEQEDVDTEQEGLDVEQDVEQEGLDIEQENMDVENMDVEQENIDGGQEGTVEQEDIEAEQEGPEQGYGATSTSSAGGSTLDLRDDWPRWLVDGIGGLQKISKAESWVTLLVSIVEFERSLGFTCTVSKHDLVGG